MSDLAKATTALAQYFGRAKDMPKFRRSPFSKPPSVRRLSISVFEIVMTYKCQASTPGFATIRLNVGGEKFNVLPLGEVLLTYADSEFYRLKGIILKLLPLLGQIES